MLSLKLFKIGTVFGYLTAGICYLTVLRFYLTLFFPSINKYLGVFKYHMISFSFNLELFLSSVILICGIILHIITSKGIKNKKPAGWFGFLIIWILPMLPYIGGYFFFRIAVYGYLFLGIMTLILTFPEMHKKAISS